MHLTDQYLDEEYDNYDYKTDEDEEYEVDLNTRSRPYPENSTSKN